MFFTYSETFEGQILYLTALMNGLLKQVGGSDRWQYFKDIFLYFKNLVCVRLRACSCVCVCFLLEL